jgi:D-aminopeptidase
MTNSVEDRPRARTLGILVGGLPTGDLNAITDVPGVLVGHRTLVEGDGIRTGVTAILPHGGNLFRDKVPAGLAVANGFGKMIGVTQVVELGELETPIALTNTLSAPQAATALSQWTLSQDGNGDVRSVNPVVGETNDGVLNDIRAMRVTSEDVHAAIDAAHGGGVPEGGVGAGTGTVCFGWKGGIGTSSRRVELKGATYAVGVLVQSNYGGSLRMAGAVLGSAGAHDCDGRAPSTADGSIMIVVATDAPLSDRNLTRLAQRSFAGLARTGSSFANGSGDYALAFSTSEAVRRSASRRRGLSETVELPNDAMSPLFVAAADATEEAIYNSMLMAQSVTSDAGRPGKEVVVQALDPAFVLAALRESLSNY